MRISIRPWPGSKNQQARQPNDDDILRDDHANVTYHTARVRATTRHADLLIDRGYYSFKENSMIETRTAVRSMWAM